MSNTTFQEFTLIHPATQTEVMVDISVNTGKILGLYCYAKDIPILVNNETDKEYKITTLPGKNPLFVHIQRKGQIFKLLLQNDFITCLDDSDSQYNDDVKIFEKAMQLYNISGELHPY